MDEPVAKVAVDLPLANLDRPFDYAVPEELDAAARPGARVKVRFAGQLRDGFILERAGYGERTDLTALHKVVSPEPVLTPAVAALVRAVADHYAGSFADVVRTAVPPRHAATEKAAAPDHPPPVLHATEGEVLAGYPESAHFLTALRTGGRPRAAWSVLPTTAPAGDWAAGFVEAAAATVDGGRGALLLAPDARQLARLQAAAAAWFGRGSFAVLAADAGPASRYRNFLATSRGAVRLVLGTRAAVFAPVHDLGLVALWDDGNDAWSEPHAPYWHAREVAALRAHLEGCGLILAAHARTAEVQQLVERSWLASLALGPAEARRRAAAVRTTGTDPARDPHASVARLPHDAFAAVRVGLASGPVLVQVPRAGYLPVLACATCRAPATCPSCGQGLSDPGGSGVQCRWCGPLLTAWRCPECGGTRLRTPVVGVARTAEEFGKAFPGTPVLQASADKPLATVKDEPALVLATPGAAPVATGGYAAAILLDAELLLGRPDLRAGEEALRRWLAVVALVRPADRGGTVVAVADPGLREIQALLRLDPVGYAERELADRAAAGFPPAVKLLTIEGAPEAVEAGRSALGLGREPGDANVGVLGPFDLPGEDALARLTLRAPLAEAPALVARVRTMLSVRAAKKEPPLRVRVDPQVLG
ncbi:MAG: primosome assembly protein PriA [Propionicimonas sp.]|uniref:primosomal protein N' family DNA-binding protein n=1 Tax=Propionicimonas sp. TaxID=1955623 RepID=UPI003D1128F5